VSVKALDLRLTSGLGDETKMILIECFTSFIRSYACTDS
jgi:hypothetical protein